MPVVKFIERLDLEQNISSMDRREVVLNNRESRINHFTKI